MLRILGSSKRLCGGVTRREMLRVGGLGIAGLGISDVLALQEASASSDGSHAFGKAKSIVLIHLYGAPSQLEWADMKPDAPVEVRGELNGIPSSLPGCDVCELLPNHAKVMDRVTVLRSMTHPHPIHGVAYALTGVPSIDVAMELRPRDSRHWPFFGSAVDYVASQRHPKPSDIPNNIALPFRFSSRRHGEVPRAGPYGAFLGSEYDPLWTEFAGTATRGHEKTLRDMVYTDNDPYMGVANDCRFFLPAATREDTDVTLDRLDTRKTLLTQLNDALPRLNESNAGRELNRHQQAALSILESDRLANALDVRKEPESARNLYGDALFGQACLAARRLTEAGTRVASVFWDEYGLAGTGWDTHWNHYPRMKNELCPGFDRGWYGLITDLDQRGLLDETLVVCTSEHGRTPKLNKAKGGGRDHWSRVYTSLMAGAGIKRGHIVGASDKHGSDVADRPISPKDLLATMYHLLGIDPQLTIRDRAGRALPLVDGKIIVDALA
ncbi:MAG: hypothetical protein CMJ64_10965 [Planctomycetaceae bacterium]|nr:hypothetical protein [Planctomycetaceae bacterium]